MFLVKVWKLIWTQSLASRSITCWKLAKTDLHPRTSLTLPKLYTWGLVWNWVSNIWMDNVRTVTSTSGIISKTFPSIPSPAVNLTSRWNDQSGVSNWNIRTNHLKWGCFNVASRMARFVIGDPSARRKHWFALSGAIVNQGLHEWGGLEDKVKNDALQEHGVCTHIWTKLI